MIPGVGGNSNYFWGMSGWDAFMAGCRIRWKQEDEIAEIKSTPFGEYRYNHFMQFCKIMEKHGFKFENDIFRNNYGWFHCFSGILPVWGPNDYDDVCYVDGMSLHSLNERGGKAIMLSLLLNQGLTQGNMIGMACPRPFNAAVKDRVDYNMAGSDLPDTEEKLIRYYEWVAGWKVHPDIKSESGRATMFYVPEGYKRNPHKYIQPEPKPEPKPKQDPPKPLVTGMFGLSDEQASICWGRY